MVSAWGPFLIFLMRIGDVSLRAFGHGVTELSGHGGQGPVDMILSVVKRKDLPAISSLVNDLAPDSFFTVEAPTSIQRGWIFPKRRK